MSRQHPYLAVEAPDTHAVIDFLGKHGVVIKATIAPNKDGDQELYIQAIACDYCNTILGEIVAVVPETDEDGVNNEQTQIW